jgi:hypothetical protein
MHLKVFLKLKKTLKPSLLGKKTQKNPKNPKKTKKTHWAGFFFKNPGFFQPCFIRFFNSLKGNKKIRNKNTK